MGSNDQALAAKCRTGADANTTDDCRVVGVVNSVQNYWSGVFARSGQKYPPAKTVIFSGSTRTGCGTATSAVGPFYCPTDRTVYLDLGFWQELARSSAPSGGPFAQAYVIAHEYGHHVQNLTGTLADGQGSKQGANSGAVRVELQADCYAGLWAHYAATTKDANGRTLITPSPPSPSRTWPTASTPPPRSATTGSSRSSRAGLPLRPGPAARPSSGRNGSSPVTRPGT